MSDTKTTKEAKSGFGSWRSPITAQLVSRRSMSFGDLMVDGNDLYWVENRPIETGRSVIVRRSPDGKLRDLLQVPFNARSLVHEYGGGAFTVSNGVVYFVNFEDQRIYRRDPSGAVKPVTHENGNRYADLIVDGTHDRIICVQEVHQGAGR
jgi:hypothetical protein